jgi:chromosome segregation ATPase
MNRTLFALLLAVFLCGGAGLTWAYRLNHQKHQHSLEVNRAQAKQLLIRATELSGDIRDSGEELSVEMAENNAELERNRRFGTGSAERIATLERQHLSATRKLRHILDLFEESESEGRAYETALRSAISDAEYLQESTGEEQNQLHQVQQALETLSKGRQRWQAALTRLDAKYAELEAQSR